MGSAYSLVTFLHQEHASTVVVKEANARWAGFFVILVYFLSLWTNSLKIFHSDSETETALVGKWENSPPLNAAGFTRLMGLVWIEISDHRLEIKDQFLPDCSDSAAVAAAGDDAAGCESRRIGRRIERGRRKENEQVW